MISLSIIDNLLKRLHRLNKIMDFLVRKIFRSILVAGSCPSNYEYFYDNFERYTCWEYASCGENKCIRIVTRTYYYSSPPYTCSQELWQCLINSSCTIDSHCP